MVFKQCPYVVALFLFYSLGLFILIARTLSHGFSLSLCTIRSFNPAPWQLSPYFCFNLIAFGIFTFYFRQWWFCFCFVSLFLSFFGFVELFNKKGLEMLGFFLEFMDSWDALINCHRPSSGYIEISETLFRDSFYPRSFVSFYFRIVECRLLDCFALFQTNKFY